MSAILNPSFCFCKNCLQIWNQRPQKPPKAKFHANRIKFSKNCPPLWVRHFVFVNMGFWFKITLPQWATPYKLGGQNYFMIGSGRGGLDMKKIVWGVWVGNAPLVRYGEKTVFLNKCWRKILVNQGCILEQMFVRRSCSQLNKLSNSVKNTSAYCGF